VKQPKSKIVRVEARQLRIHPFAQRQLVPAKLKKLMAEIDLDAIGVLHAVEYAIDGVIGIWVIDGQHRLRCLMENGLGEWVVEVKVHTDATDHARASALFLKLNDRSPVAVFDKFENEVSAGAPWALSAIEILKQHGLKVTRGSNDGCACCVSALRSLYSRDNGRVLDLTIKTVIAAWGRTAPAMEGKLLEGIGALYETYNGSVDQAALVKKLAKYPGGASALMGDAKGLRQFRKTSLSRCVAERIIETYNAGRRVGKLDPL
jgi:hypothetical protein